MNRKQGFTLIELMLAMSFVGMLLIAIAVTSMQMTRTYTKGLTIREVNQAGRAISQDIERTVAGASPFLVSPARTGETTDPPNATTSKYVSKPTGGRLCTGTYSYAWNYGKTRELANDPSLQPAYNQYTTGTDTPRLVKVKDLDSSLCSNMNSQIKREDATELLAAGDRNLAIQQLTVVAGNKSDVYNQALYSIVFVIGSNDQSQLNPSSTACLPPSSGSGNEDFRAINQFDIVVRAGNSSENI